MAFRFFFFLVFEVMSPFPSFIRSLSLCFQYSLATIR